MSVNSSRPCAADPPVLALLPIIAVVFIAYLVIGLALPVLAEPKWVQPRKKKQQIIWP
jgi:hypothetical protein